MKRILSILLYSMLVLSLTGCGKEKEQTKQEEKEYYCEEGTLKGKKCESKETEEAIKTCPEGYTLTDGKCIKTTTTNAKATKSCSDGYTLSGNTCLSNETYDKVTTQECRLPAEYDIGEYTYADGSKMQNGASVQDGECWYNACNTWKDGICYGGSISKTEFTTVTSCPSGTKDVSGKCYKMGDAKTTYTCDEGTLSQTKCIITETKEATGSCETEGFTYNSESDMCERVTITEALEK